MDLPANPEDLAALARATEAAASAAANPRKPLLTGPKRHHYLPKFYLDGFSQDGLVAVYDREENEVRLQQPKDTTVIGHFYTMEDAEGRRRYEVEALLSEYEGKSSPVIKKLAAKEAINADERTDLAIFIALAATRTPDIVDSLKLAKVNFILDTAKRLFNDVETVAVQLRTDKLYARVSEEEIVEEAKQMVSMAQNNGLTVNVEQKWAVGMAIRMAFAVAPILAGRDWLVLVRENGKKSFITTDAPVMLTTTGPREENFWGVGFGNDDALVLFPLTQSCVLALFGSTGELRWTTANTEKMRHINLAMADRCQRFVIGRDASLLKSLAESLGLAGKKWQPKMQAELPSASV